ncbi:MAG: hypothetical protein H0V68_03560 [Actinobacteria bacterium]|nr:hypothetical protein [Actinomycetota bacterium]
MRLYYRSGGREGVAPALEHGLAVGDEHALDRQVEQRPQEDAELRAVEGALQVPQPGVRHS